MSDHSPRRHDSVLSAHVTRVRWENLAIAGLGVVVAIVAAVLIMTGDDARPAAASSAPETSQVAPVPADTGDMVQTLEEALLAVEQAKQLMARADFDGAADLLARIDSPLDEESGAVALRETLDARETTWNELTATLEDQVEAEQWLAAVTTVGRLADIATLPPDMQETADLVGREADAVKVTLEALRLEGQGKRAEALAHVRAGIKRTGSDSLRALLTELEQSPLPTAAPAAAGGGSTAAGARPAAGGSTSTSPGPGTNSSSASTRPSATRPATGTATRPTGTRPVTTAATVPAELTAALLQLPAVGGENVNAATIEALLAGLDPAMQAQLEQLLGM